MQVRIRTTTCQNGASQPGCFPGSTSQQIVDDDVAHEVDEEEREAEGVADESADVVREVVVAPDVEREEADVVEVRRRTLGSGGPGRAGAASFRRR